MPEAQLGSAVLLTYRKPQGRQTGDNVVLNYNAGAEDPFFVPMFGGSVARWGTPSKVNSELVIPSPDVTTLTEGPKVPWGSATKLQEESKAVWMPPYPIGESKTSPWASTDVLEVPDTKIPWGTLSSPSVEASSPWKDNTLGSLAMEELIPWGVAVRALQSIANPWRGTVGTERFGEHLIPWGLARVANNEGKYPWDRKAPSHDHLWGIVYPSGPVTDEHGTIVITIKKAYIMENEVTARTVADGVTLPLQSVSLSIDSTTWAWGFSATIPAVYLPYLQSLALVSPVELIVTVNGEDFLILVEEVSRSRALGKASLSISGRGHSAYLSEPYSPRQHFTNTIQKTCRQLFEDSLTFNSAPLGWTVNWGLPDWSIPAGTWDHTGTYIEAITAIASSVGGYIQPDPLRKILNVLSRYPTLPSEWSSGNPYMILPSAIVQTEAIAWKEKPNYNGVYISGDKVGITAFVRKDGTIGDYLAEAKANKLITHEDAARELGRSILVDTGKMSSVTLSMPILDSMGLIFPGNIVRYQDGATTRHGITRAIDISSNGVSARQTIELEVHDA